MSNSGLSFPSLRHSAWYLWGGGGRLRAEPDCETRTGERLGTACPSRQCGGGARRDASFTDRWRGTAAPGLTVLTPRSYTVSESDLQRIRVGLTPRPSRSYTASESRRRHELPHPEARAPASKDIRVCSDARDGWRPLRQIKMNWTARPGPRTVTCTRTGAPSLAGRVQALQGRAVRPGPSHCLPVAGPPTPQWAHTCRSGIRRGRGS